MKVQLFAFGFIAMAFAVSPSLAAPLLADGIYRCTISNMHLGDIEIMGSSYRGPSFDKNWGETYTFEETSGPTINWHGPLGGISASGKIVSTVLKNAGGNRVGFDITIQNERGNFQQISCSPE